MRSKKALMLAVAAAPFMATAAFAQDGASSASEGADDRRALPTILVTARKREESIQDVPVVVQAFDSEFLESFGTSDFSDLNDLVSGLSIYADGPIAPSINVRGIQGNAINATQDDSVATNIDGVQHSNAQIFRFGLFELEAVEVLKGPQALFFGKNSPGGVVSLRTKNPTDEFYSEFQAGYEVYGERVYGHGIVSGPLTDTWGARFAVRAATQDGYFENIAGNLETSPTIGGPSDRTDPDFEEIFMIGTLRGEYDSATITLKGMHARRNGGGYNQIQIVQLNGSDANLDSDGTLDKRFSNPPFSDQTGSILGRSEDTYDNELTQFTADASFELDDNWTLHSITGIIDINNFYFGNAGGRPNSIAHGLGIGQRVHVDAITQEIRFQGDYDDLRILFGGYYDDRTVDTNGQVWLSESFTITPDTQSGVDSNSWSAFAQVAYDVTDRLEVSVGGRYTQERKTTYAENLETNTPLVFINDELDYTNFSPEATVSYDITDDVNFFANYKQGFKSGGFDSSTTARNTASAGGGIDDAFNEELVEGFEFGLKTEWFDNTLRLNLTGFIYDYEDLQLSTFFTDSFGVTTVGTVNAAEAKLRGFEADMLWATPIEGLTATANFAYIKNEFDNFIQPCNEFQLFVDATGCDVDVDNNPATSADSNNPASLLFGTGFDAQDRAGTNLRRAPEWAGSAGLNYNTVMANDLEFRASTLVSFSGEYNGSGENNPQMIQDAYAILNASVGIGAADGGWQFDVLGRNLNDKAYFTTAFDSSRSADPQPGGGTGQEHVVATRNAPRQVFLQLTVRPQALLD